MALAVRGPDDGGEMAGNETTDGELVSVVPTKGNADWPLHQSPTQGLVRGLEEGSKLGSRPAGRALGWIWMDFIGKMPLMCLALALPFQQQAHFSSKVPGQ